MSVIYAVELKLVIDKHYQRFIICCVQSATTPYSRGFIANRIVIAGLCIAGPVLVGMPWSANPVCMGLFHIQLDVDITI